MIKDIARLGNGEVVLKCDVEPALIENLEKILARSGAAFPMPMARTLQPFRLNGPERPPLTRAEIVAIQSSVLSVSPESSSAT